MADIEGLPYWTVRFDQHGDPDRALVDELLAGLGPAEVTDLFVFSHGWNSSPAGADRLYRRFFSLMATELRDGDLADGHRVGVLGVVWPSMRWLDEPIPDFPAVDGAGGVDDGTAVDVTASPVSPDAAPAELVGALKEVFDAPVQRDALDRMGVLLEQRPEDPQRLTEFQQLMVALDTAEPGSPPEGADEDIGELNLLRDDPVAMSERMLATIESVTPPHGGVSAAGDDHGDAAALGGLGQRLWRGALEALRQLTYFEMKRRAGTVGERGLGPLCARIARTTPGVRLHLVGHSFGARLVSFALRGLPSEGASPVKSLLLLQGAFSHFAFARSLPFRPADGGALAGHEARVDGPVASVYSIHDTAVGVLYPAASLASGDVASFDATIDRWGAIGHDGAREVDAVTGAVRPDGPAPDPPPRGFLNVDASAVVRVGGPPAGAHSDIFHPELARLALRAAGLTGQREPVHS